MLNNNIIIRLKNIERSLIDRGEYVERFDALSLSTVDIDNNDSSSNSSVSLTGLSKLIAEITTVLHEAYVDQQTG